jgi:hypothetical protein
VILPTLDLLMMSSWLEDVGAREDFKGEEDYYCCRISSFY